MEINADTVLVSNSCFIILKYNFNNNNFTLYNAFNLEARSRNRIPKLRCNLKYNL